MQKKVFKLHVFDQIPETVNESIAGDIIHYYRYRNSDIVDYKTSDINTDKYSSTVFQKSLKCYVNIFSKYFS